MQIHVQTFTVNKRFPLRISRGTTAQSTNIWVRIEHENVEGWGEASPFSVGDHEQSAEVTVAELQRVKPMLIGLSPWERQKIEWILTEVALLSAARAALDMALHDWSGKQVGLPLWRLWGLNREIITPTSVTIGINPPEVARQQVQNWLYGINTSLGISTLKVKLGSPQGITADQAMLIAIREEAPANTQISIDANGGWTLNDAIEMCYWLAEQGVSYVEQPLPRGQEENLPKLYEQSPLPIFVDESCFTSSDIPQLADRVHGVNIKLMKCGGLTEAIRMVHTARACGLQIMFGCYSDSSLANTAAIHLTPLADYVDLDSHLNLIDDPFTGAFVQDGRALPPDLPGLGVQYHVSNI